MQRARLASVARRVRLPPIPPWARHRGLWWPVACAAITVFTWHGLSWSPGAGIDPSWQAGLMLATVHQLAYGRDVVFTYGPLGFVNVPATWSNELATIGFAYQVVVRVATAAAVLFGARRSFGTLVSLLLALIVGSIAGVAPEASVLFVVTIWAVRVGLDGRRALLLAAAVGAVSAVQLLDKVSGGITFTLMSLILLLCLPRRRLMLVAVGAGSCVVAFFILWFALGQPVSSIWGYARGSLAVSAGYSAAMGVAVPSLDWALYAALLVLVAGAWATWSSLPGMASVRRAGVVLIWVVFWFSNFKEGFVREDSGHVLSFFAVALVAWFGFYWRPEHRGQALTSIAALLVFALALEGVPLTTELAPVASARAAGHDLKVALSSGRKNAISALARRNILAFEGIDQSARRLIGTYTVAVYPTELAIVWAERLDWRPIPVLQSYVGYTSYLDHLDASFLASSRAPQRILINGLLGIDGRAPEFDQPQLTRTMLCRYRPLNPGAPGYAVLADGPNRCSAPRPLSVEVANWGASVPVPAPPTRHSLVSVDISGVDPSGLEALGGALYRPELRTILIDGAGYRLITGTAGDGLPLRVSGNLDYPKAIQQVPQAATIGVARAGAPKGGRPITYRFFYQTYTP